MRQITFKHMIQLNQEAPYKYYKKHKQKAMYETLI